MSADVWENLQEIFADLDALSDRYIRTHPLCAKSCNMRKPVDVTELISSSILLSITMEMINLSIKNDNAKTPHSNLCVEMGMKMKPSNICANNLVRRFFVRLCISSD